MMLTLKISGEVEIIHVRPRQCYFGSLAFQPRSCSLESFALFYGSFFIEYPYVSELTAIRAEHEAVVASLREEISKLQDREYMPEKDEQIRTQKFKVCVSSRNCSQ